MGVFKQFAGFDNYVRVLKDRSFQTAIQNTFIYVLLASPVSILIALLLALIAAAECGAAKRAKASCKENS